MQVIQLKIGKRAQVVIPKIVRQAVGITEGGSAILIVDQGQAILLGDPKKYGQRIRGLGKEIWSKVGANNYLQQERSSWRA